MNLVQAQAQEDCDRFVELADLTDFAVQLRYNLPTLPSGLNRSEILSKVESLRDHVEDLVRNTPVSE